MSGEGNEASLGGTELQNAQEMMMSMMSGGEARKEMELSWNEPLALPLFARLGDLGWRNKVLDDLYELDAFLQQRKGELQSVEALNLLASLHTAPPLVQHQSMVCSGDSLHVTLVFRSVMTVSAIFFIVNLCAMLHWLTIGSHLGDVQCH